LQVTFIHTLAALAPLFAELAQADLPGATVRQIVDEPLLDRIRRRGHATEDDRARLRGHLRIAEELGATAVLVTCSTLSPLLDGETAAIPLLKIDEAMVGEAVRRGGRIVVLATNEATLEPTKATLHAGGLIADPELVVIEGAFGAYKRGDYAAHDSRVVDAITGTTADTIVLAQASMDRVIPLLAPVTAAGY
jgi:Asp/Glu/hydantoin racemase